MSQENVDAVRRAIVHFNETGDLLWELYDPQVELVIDPLANLAGTYLGHEGLRRYLDELTVLRPSETRIEIDELIDARRLGSRACPLLDAWAVQRRNRRRARWRVSAASRGIGWFLQYEHRRPPT